MNNDRESRRADALRRLGALLDGIDAQTRRPGEPSLRTVVAQHARAGGRPFPELRCGQVGEQSHAPHVWDAAVGWPAVPGEKLVALKSCPGRT